MTTNLGFILTNLFAIFAAGVVQHLSQQKLPVSKRDRFFLGIGAFCGGMIGAKLPYLFFDPEGFASGKIWLDSGKTVLTGLTGGYLGVEYVKWYRNVRIKTGDSFVIPLAIALGIGRIGCFIGGCCFGIESNVTWAVDFGDHVMRHPTQIYESIFHFSAALLFLYWRRRNIFKGNVLKIYYLSYFVYRFVTEWIRPEPRLWFGITPYQILTVFLFCFFGALLLHDIKLQKRIA